MLEAIELETIPSLGYAFQVETTYRAIRAGFRVVEVPIAFRDRRVGRVEDDRVDRARGGVAGAGDALSGAARSAMFGRRLRRYYISEVAQSAQSGQHRYAVDKG